MQGCNDGSYLCLCCHGAGEKRKPTISPTT
jgi:hypothetical protein